MCIVIYKSVYGYICLQGFCNVPDGFWHCSSHTSMGAGNAPCKFISSKLEMPLYFVVRSYYDVLYFFNGFTLLLVDMHTET